MLKDLYNQFPRNDFPSLNYRPPRWESPMEQKLLYALRYMGLGVETQVPVADHYVDMIVFGRSSIHEVILECDDPNLHHNLIDEFRDDELIDTARLPIAHIWGTEIAKSSERCALSIIERWFPKRGDYTELSVDDPLGSFPVGVVRPIGGDAAGSQSNRVCRDYLRYIVGNISECHFVNNKEKKRVEEWKVEFANLDLPKRTFSQQELARFYILLFYREPDLSSELQRLDHFLEHRKWLYQIQEENEAEIPE